MKPSPKPGVTGYLQLFVLIAVAIGGSAVLLGSTWTYSRSLSGASVYFAQVSLRQGASAAVESVTITNGGQASVGSFVLSTSQLSTSANFCYSVSNPGTQSLVTTSCPTLQSNPSSVQVLTPVSPGGSLTVELLIMGTVFAVGSSHLVTVSASNGGQQSLQVEVVPA